MTKTCLIAVDRIRTGDNLLLKNMIKPTDVYRNGDCFFFFMVQDFNDGFSRVDLIFIEDKSINERECILYYF